MNHREQIINHIAHMMINNMAAEVGLDRVKKFACFLVTPALAGVLKENDITDIGGLKWKESPAIDFGDDDLPFMGHRMRLVVTYSIDHVIDPMWFNDKA